MGITNSEKYNTELFEYLSRTNNTFAMCGCFKEILMRKALIIS